MSLTDSQIDAYLDTDGNTCPSCGSREIKETEQPKLGYEHVYISYHCERCGQKWQAEFAFVLSWIVEED